METETKAYKTILEEQKLKLEILELEKKWYKKPTFFVPTIASLSSIFILWVTGFFNTKIESLNNSIDKLNKVKDELTTDSLKLAKEKNLLQLQINSLSDSLKTATMPIITIVLYKMFGKGEEDVGIYMSNTGTGTAYFKEINFYYNNEVFKYEEKNPLFLQKMLIPLGLNSSYMETESKITSNNIKTSGSLGPGQIFPILRVVKSKSNLYNIEKFLTAIVGLEIEVIYQSSKGKVSTMRRKFTKEECEILY
ncbi:MULTISPECIES: hypothetical protein [Flavobacterium]|uniref:hypothetical protein n=1 Tax=Flavobacterium TaxID=237 RepID=UPI002113AE6F|nr:MULTISPECIES: hypothetical protein [Flavobacterium]UUF13756.1 hypothetical protein NLJ00_21080 [Flavobacterium panici]